MRPYSRFSSFRLRNLVLLVLPVTLLACTLGQAATPFPTVSPLPTLTSSAIQTTTAGQASATCTPHSDWPTMTIAPGDTLSSIAAEVGSTVDELAAANCISNPAAITAGETLYVPTRPNGAGAGASIPTGLPDAGAFPTAVNQAPACDGTSQWFFNFGFGASDSGCPGPVITSNAIGENF
ncbi:MAG TPA: LysM domain-containing protein, partial [Aggregatilineales bacterium]|nr:LysM domain-containing protein [Aggregatilineales bacterium]